MKTVFLGLTAFLATGFLLPSAPSAAQTSRAQAAASTEATLVSAERKWLDAVYGLNTAALDAVEAEDFLVVTPATTLDKTEHIRSSLSKATVSAKPAGPAQVTLSRQLVRIYGSVAVISDVCTVTGGGPNPVTLPGTYWQTEVWRLEGDTWRISDLHISRVAHAM